MPKYRVLEEVQQLVATKLLRLLLDVTMEMKTLRISSRVSCRGGLLSLLYPLCAILVISVESLQVLHRVELKSFTL